MRLNQYIALHSGVSRRAADRLIQEGKVLVNDTPATLGQTVNDKDKVTVDGLAMRPTTKIITIMLNKPAGYVCSREGQGSKTIYELLPKNLYNLKSVGRLDKDSSGLLLLTNDGQLANQLTHPSYKKEKIYEIKLDRDLTEEDFETITKKGVPLEDGLSKLELNFINDANTEWKVTMHEGRNRQIRRTFEALGYRVKKLHRTHFGSYKLEGLKTGGFNPL